MIPIDIQVSWLKVKVKGEAYSQMLGKGGISVSQTSIFSLQFNFVYHINNATYNKSSCQLSILRNLWSNFR